MANVKSNNRLEQIFTPTNLIDFLVEKYLKPYFKEENITEILEQQQVLVRCWIDYINYIQKFQ